jgi:SH3 domain protein
VLKVFKSFTDALSVWRSPRRSAVLAIIAIFAVSAAQAEDRWVTDEFEVMMRSGKGPRKSIVRQLKSGTRVEILETDLAEGYSRVRLQSGTEGWVLTRYLKRGPTAQLRLPELEQRLQASEAKRRELQQQVTELTRKGSELSGEIQSLQASNSSVEGELERITRLSASSVQLDEENRRLKQRLVDNEQEVDRLARENERLADRSSREWFLIGSVVLVTGLLLGLIIPRVRWRKKSSWGDF